MNQPCALVEDRATRFGYRGLVVWLTGLPAAGKTTLASAADKRLTRDGFCVCVLDGDDLRAGINSDLGFSADERVENVRRIGEIAAMLSRQGFICLVATISPFATGREAAREAAKPLPFLEVLIEAPLDVRESRDPKGLFRRVRLGQLTDLTGLGSPYERPKNADLIIDTSCVSVQEGVDRITNRVHILAQQSVNSR